MPLDLCRLGKGTTLKKADERLLPKQSTVKPKAKKSPPPTKKAFVKADSVALKFVYSDANHHRQGSGIISGGERVAMIKETLAFQLDHLYDAITITVEHEQGGIAKFDVIIDNQLWHNSVRDGVPGPSALDQMYTIVKQILM